MGNGGFYGCLSESEGVSVVERKTTNTCIRFFSSLFAESPWTSINQNQTLATHNADRRLRFCTYMGQPLSKQLYTTNRLHYLFSFFFSNLSWAKRTAEPLSCGSWFHSHFDNVMKQFIILPNSYWAIRTLWSYLIVTPRYKEDPVITGNIWKPGRITVKYVATHPAITNLAFTKSPLYNELILTLPTHY